MIESFDDSWAKRAMINFFFFFFFFFFFGLITSCAVSRFLSALEDQRRTDKGTKIELFDRNWRAQTNLHTFMLFKVI